MHPESQVPSKSLKHQLKLSFVGNAPRLLSTDLKSFLDSQELWANYSVRGVPHKL